MRYRILGPLSVTDGERSVAVTAGRDRVVLAMLLLHPGRVVGVAALVEAVWGVEPPTTARGQLQTCVSRLRRTLPAGTIESDPAGYRITPRPGELDAGEFARLVAEARAGADPAIFRQALDLWRGDALAGIDSHAVRLGAAALDEQRAAVLEDWVELELFVGRERDLIGELTTQVERFPLRERLRGQLMTALFRCGRQADALAEYRRAHEVARDELGLEPGQELQDLHAAILTGTLPSASASASASMRPQTPIAAVRCLPRTVGDFTGRAAVVDRLVAAIDAADPAGPALGVIDGMAGSGKTTLALHVAALVGERYPDAHLFVDLHGHSERAPIDPSAALLILLRQLGVAAEQIPVGLVDRIGLWRTELAKRRALVLFDNAGSSAQIADLLPTAPGSLALVTSRRRLAGLDGVQPESLPVFAEAEAVALLERIVGDRVRAEPDAAAEVVRRCGRLPLAIRLAGARLAHRPRWRVSDLVRRLGEPALPELAAEDRTVADAFAVSFGQLAEPTRRLFRKLGAYPGLTFDAPAVAALGGLPLDDAQDLLDDLVDVHLVDEPEPGLFRLHDLIREYAAALVAELPAAERRAAVAGVLDLQMHAAAATTRPQHRPALDRDLRSPVPLRPDLLDALGDPEARLERERRNLVAHVEAAIAAGLDDYAWQLPRAAWRYLWFRSYYEDVKTLFRRALVVTERLGDRSATATVANYLASSLVRLAELDEAERLLKRSIAIREELGEWGAAASTLCNLGAVYGYAGRHGLAFETGVLAHRVMITKRRVTEPVGRLNNMAMASLYLGNYADAVHYNRMRLMFFMTIGDLGRIADCVCYLAVGKYRLGLIDVEAAIRQVRIALRIADRDGDRHMRAEANAELGVLLADAGRFGEAAEAHRLAVSLGSDLNDAVMNVRFHDHLAATLLRGGDRAAAQEEALEALARARATGVPYMIALASRTLAGCIADTEPARARTMWQEARDIFASLGSNLELAEVEERLAAGRGGTDQLHNPAGGGTMVA